MPMPMSISLTDWVIVIVYLVGVVGLGCRAGISAKKKGRQRGESVAGDYFLAAHTLRWPVIGLALFATNISCVHLVSLAQSGYDTGLLNGNFEWMAAFALILLGFFFAPFYLKSQVATLPDFLEKRYCRECRDLLAVVSIVAAIVFHIAFPLATGWLILHDILGIEKWTCICVLCGLTGIYTVVGGLAAVAITETIQTVVLLLGAFVITWFAWEKTGGWQGMTSTLNTATAATQGLTDGKLMNMLRPHGDDSGMPWYASLLGYPVLGIWYWCADQTIVQRVLGAKSENDARVGPIFCGLIKILPVFIFIVPGLMLYTAVQQGNLASVTQVRLIQTVGNEKIIAITGDVGGAAIAPIHLQQGELLDLSQLAIRPTGKDSALIIGPNVPVKTLMSDRGETIPAPPGIHPYRSKQVYAVMIKKLLPTGLLGLLAAALMAALMGNLSSASNSIATLVSYDIVKRFRPTTSDKQLVLIGRIATLSSIALGIALVPLLDRKVSIFNAFNEIIAHLAPPITCVFLLGVFWPAASARSAKWTLWLGSLLGVATYSVKALHEGYPLPFRWVPAFFTATPFMMMAFYLFVACLILQILVTRFQPKLAGEDPQALYWLHPLDALKAPGWPGILNYKVFAAIVMIAMVSLYLIFH